MSGESKPPSMHSMMLPKSDLLNRLGDFLPKMQKANEELENLNDTEGLRVDLQLEADEEDNSSDDDENSKSEQEKEPEEFLIRECTGKKEKSEPQNQGCTSAKFDGDSEEQPTIEFKLALGKFKNDNPMMKLLGENSDEEEKQAIVEEEVDGEEKSNAKVVNMIQSTGNKRKRTGPLITEMS